MKIYKSLFMIVCCLSLFFVNSAYSQVGGGASYEMLTNKALTRGEIIEYLENNGQKLKTGLLIPLIKNVGVYSTYISDWNRENWSFLINYGNLSESNFDALKNDIFLSPYIFAEEDQIYANLNINNSMKCNPKSLAWTILRHGIDVEIGDTNPDREVVHYGICFNIEKLLTAEVTAAQLAAIAFHEHGHHFGLDDQLIVALDIPDDFDINGNEKIGLSESDSLRIDILNIFNDNGHGVVMEPIAYGPFPRMMSNLIAEGQDDDDYLCPLLSGNPEAISSVDGHDTQVIGAVPQTITATSQAYFPYSIIRFDGSVAIVSGPESTPIYQNVNCLIPRRPYEETMKRVPFWNNNGLTHNFSGDELLIFKMQGPYNDHLYPAKYAQFCKALTDDPYAEWIPGTSVIAKYDKQHNESGEELILMYDYLKINYRGDIERSDISSYIDILKSIICLVPEKISRPDN